MMNEQTPSVNYSKNTKRENRKNSKPQKRKIDES